MVLPDFVEPSPSNSFLPNAHEVGSLKEKSKILLKFSKKVFNFTIILQEAFCESMLAKKHKNKLQVQKSCM